MDLVRLCSKHLGEAIATLNEEDAMEFVLEALSNIPVIRMLDWLKDGLAALPEGTTLADMIENEDEFDDILDNSLDWGKLLDEETIADLEAKIGGKS